MEMFWRVLVCAALLCCCASAQSQDWEQVFKLHFLPNEMKEFYVSLTYQEQQAFEKVTNTFNGEDVNELLKALYFASPEAARKFIVAMSSLSLKYASMKPEAIGFVNEIMENASAQGDENRSEMYKTKILEVLERYDDLSYEARADLEAYFPEILNSCMSKRH
ncbi:hypothetical protein OESDEN_19174, partial [Oesophagostomum dentatum]